MTADTIVHNPRDDGGSRIIVRARELGLVTQAQADALIHELVRGTLRGDVVSELERRGLISNDGAAKLRRQVVLEIPGYAVEEELGQGAMGMVYAGRQLALDRRVALKVLHPRVSHDPDVKARFGREARALARLNHPNIVQVYDSGEVGGQLFLALEFVEGDDLQVIIDRERRIEPSRAVSLIRDAACGLAHAHEAGLIHRDIKPANLLVPALRGSTSRVSEVKISDLGLARVKDQRPGDGLTETGTVMGTPAYMSPEQAEGAETDHRTDIYALGATLYHMLTGRMPFEASSIYKTLMLKREGTLVVPPELKLSDDLLRVLDGMLARDVEHRYADYDRLIADLEALLSGGRPAIAAIPAEQSSIRRAPRKPALGKLVVGAFALGVFGAVLAWASFAKMRPPPTPPAKPPADPQPELPEDPPPVAEPPVVPPVAPPVTPEDPEPADPPLREPEPPERVSAAKIEPLIASLEAFDVPALASRAAQLEMIRGLIASLEPVDELRLKLSFEALINVALCGDGGWTETLTARYEAGEYEALAEGVAVAQRLLSVTGCPAPASFERLVDLSLATTGEAGSWEREAWEEIRAASDPLSVLERSEGFAERFPFSPVKSEVEALRQAAMAAAPRCELEAPEGRVVLIDGQAKSSGAWTGRLVKGWHRIALRGEGLYELGREVEVTGPGRWRLFEHPVMAERQVDPTQGAPLWNPRTFAQAWRQAGGWRVLKGAAGVVGEARPDGEATATRDLASVISRSRLREAEAWVFELELMAPEDASAPSFAAEVRCFVGAEACLAFGRDATRVYFGVRRGDALELRSEQRIDPAKPPQVFELRWDGEVALVRVGDAPLGSLRPDWAEPKLELTFAVRAGEAMFRNLQLLGLRPPGE